MARYKLKKDLPTFKAGEICQLDQSGNLVQNQSKPSWVVVYSKGTLEKFPNILTDWFEEIPEEPKTVWDLEDGDKYYRVAASGLLGYYTKIWQDNDLDNLMRDMGEIFLTENDAKKEVARRRAKQILLRDTKGFKPDWKNGYYDKYEVVYEYSDDDYHGWGLHVNACNYCSTHEDLWFATAEDARASIKAHPNEWKTYLGVEE